MRVLELSDRDESAAYCGKLFARWGADVTRVEGRERAPSPQPLDLYLHRGKQRVTLDARDAAGRARLDALAAQSDILITDLSPRELDAIGVETLGAASPRLVRVSITPFGLSGPYRDYEATASTLLALGGYTVLMGDPGRAPLTMPGNYAYYQAADFAFVAAQAAQLAAERGAPPARLIEVSVLEALATLHQFTDTMWLANGIVRSRHGNRWENLCPTTLLPCGDGWFGMNVLQTFWLPFAHWIGRPEWSEPEHPLATNAGRMQHEDLVEDAIVEAVRGLTRRELFREGQETWRVPVGHAVQLGELLDDPHLAHRRFFETLNEQRGADGAPLRAPGSPFRFAGESPATAGAAPRSHPRAAEAGAPGGASEATAPDATRPLAGVRIIDLTRIWAGPLATRILADLGAEVIKVEAPSGRGPAAGMPGSAPVERPWNRQPLFNKLNRNKQSVAIDLKSAAGRHAFLALVRASDVVIENFSARAMPGLGLGYEALRAVKPDVIYIGMPSFGMDGPYRDYVGLGPSIEPTTGLTALMGYGPDEPRVTSKAISDAIGGTNAAVAVLVALARHARTGEGACIDLSQQECGIAFLGEHVLERQLTGREPERRGNAHRAYAPHGVYRCAGDDDWIAIAVRDDAEWAALDAAAGRGWAADARFATLEARRAHRAALDDAIEAWTCAQEKRALMAALQARRVPAGAVLATPEWTSDPHLVDRGYFAELTHPEAGPERWDGLPLRFDGRRPYDRWVPAPLLGGDNVAVLREIARISADDIARLAERGVIVDRPPA